MTQIPNLSATATRLLRQSRFAKTLAFQEGQGGGTTMRFLQDTGSAWLPKILISRSGAEGAEVSLLEFGESAMTYGLPALLGPGLGKAFYQLLGKNKGFERKLLSSTHPSLMALREQGSTEGVKAVDKAMAVKSAVILSTIGAIGLWGESLVNYGKNLMTAKVFHKDKFSDVVNLSQGQIAVGDMDHSPQVKKAKRRIKQMTGVMAGILGGAFLLARFGHRAEALRKFSGQVVKHLDFGFGRTEAGKVTYGLGNRKGLLGAIMLVCSFPYLDSARDNYERLETALRLPIVFSYILFGQEWIQKGMIKLFPGLFKGALDDKNQVLGVQQIAENALKAAAKGGSTITPEIERAAAQEMRQGLLAKGMSVGVPLASGILVTGLGLGLINRFLTAYRFKKQNQPGSPPQGLPNQGNAQPWPVSPMPRAMPHYGFANQPIRAQSCFAFPDANGSQPFAGMGVNRPQRLP